MANDGVTKIQSANKLGEDNCRAKLLTSIKSL